MGMTDVAKTEPPKLDPKIIAKVVMDADLSGLSQPDLLRYYANRCELMDLDPATKPFDLVRLQGKLKLYPNKQCAAELTKVHGITVEIIRTERIDKTYTVTARATMPNGQYVDDAGSVEFKGGDSVMKAHTKAKRRAVLSLCGLGMHDKPEAPAGGGSIVQSSAKMLTADEFRDMRDRVEVLEASTDITLSRWVADNGMVSKPHHEQMRAYIDDMEGGD